MAVLLDLFKNMYVRYRQYQRIVAALNLVRDPDISFEWYDGAWGSMLFNALRTTADGGADDEAAGRVLDDPQGRRSESVSIMVGSKCSAGLHETCFISALPMVQRHVCESGDFLCMTTAGHRELHQP